MQLIRGSEIGDFLRCRKRWDYRWMQNLKAKKPEGKLFFGTLGHKFMEAYYGSLMDTTVAARDMLQLFEETDKTLMEQTDIDGLWENVSAVTKNYVEQWQHVDKGWTIIAQELTFAIPLDNNAAYTGTIDLVFLDAEKRLWFSDYKFVQSVASYTKASAMDRQISRYWWALQQLVRGNGYLLHDEEWVHIDRSHIILPTEPHGFIYNLVSKDVPHPPKELKKGGLSVDKSQHTTYKIYCETLVEKGLAVWDDQHPCHVIANKEYADILQMLHDNETEEGNRFFRRVSVFRQQTEIDSAINEFYEQALESIYVRESLSGDRKLPYDPIHRTITHDCDWDCPFKGLCVSSMDGSNTTLLKNLMYETFEDTSVPLLGGI